MSVKNRDFLAPILLAIIFMPMILTLVGANQAPVSSQAGCETPIPSPPPESGIIRLSEKWPPQIYQWRDFIESAAVQYRMDPNLIAAVMQRESGGNPAAYGRDGEIGLMQILKRYHSCATWDPRGNILCGTHILAYYQQRAGGDWRTGLAFYNCGETGTKQGRCGTKGGYAYADYVISLWNCYPNGNCK